MKQNRGAITDQDLHSYVDGELDAVRAAEVEKFLQQNTDASEQVAIWRRQNDTLRALYGHLADEPVPDRLDPHRLAANIRTEVGRWRSIAAALILVTLGGALGWFGHDLTHDQPVFSVSLVQQAMAAHAVYAVEVRHPVEVGADEEQHLVKWLSKRLDRPLKAPDLSAGGFELVGGRLLPATGGPAAQFMYEDKGGNRITLYVTTNPAGEQAAFRFATLGAENAFYWLEPDINYVVVGSIPRDRLYGVSKLVYEQLI